MARIYAWKTGTALAVAVVVGYAALTALFAAWPLAGDAFHNAITTGSNYDSSGAKVDWSFSAFAYVAALLTAWGFATGALFAWVHNLLHRSDIRS